MNKLFPKAIQLALAVLMLASFAACQNQAATTGGASPPGSTSGQSTAAQASTESGGDNTSAVTQPVDTRTSFEKLFANGPVPAQDKDGLWGYIDSTGSYAISPQFTEAGRFTGEGLALVKDGDSRMYGYIDSKGDYAIEARFKKAYSFSDGLAVVNADGLFGYINPSGAFEIEPMFNSAFNFVEGLAPVAGQMAEPLYLPGYSVPATIAFGFIDKSGAYVIPPTYADASSFSNGVAFVTYWSDRPANDTLNDTVHPIDKSGNELSPTPFKLNSYYGTSDATRKRAAWNEGFCTLSTNGNVVLVDEGFNKVQPKDGSSYDKTNGFRMGCAAVRDSASGLWGYINTAGDWVIRPQYIDAGNFNSDGKAVVGIATGAEYTKEYLGTGPIFQRKVIDNTGAVLSDYPGGLMWMCLGAAMPVEDEPGYFNQAKVIYLSGLYPVMKNDWSLDKNGYVDFDENIVIELEFEEAGAFVTDKSYAKVKQGGYYGVIDGNGAWLIEPQYGDIKLS